VITERPFSERVLARVAAAERARQQRARFRPILPLAIIIVVGGAWAIALFDGLIALHLAIETVAWVSAVGALEQRLSTALLGDFAPLPLVVSMLLFVAAIVWVRAHQPDPVEPRR